MSQKDRGKKRGGRLTSAKATGYRERDRGMKRTRVTRAGLFLVDARTPSLKQYPGAIEARSRQDGPTTRMRLKKEDG